MKNIVFVILWMSVAVAGMAQNRVNEIIPIYQDEDSMAFITRKFHTDGYTDTYIYTKTVRVWYDSAYNHTMDSIRMFRASKDSLRRAEEMNKKEAARLADSTERARKEFLHHYFWPDDF